MPHATEGELHAYVDGALPHFDAAAAERLTAHLERCPDCRARLDEARTVRDRSAALLDAALGGEVPGPPPFTEIARQAEERGGVRRSPAPPGRRAVPPGQRLAWAASLVVALGAGWMANALLRDGRPIPESPAAVERQIPARNQARALREADAGGASVEREAEPRPAQDELSAGGGPSDDRSNKAEGAGAVEGARQQAQAPRAAEARASVEPEEDRALDRVELADIAAESAAETSMAAASPAPADPERERLARARWRASELEAAAAWIGVEPRRIPELPLLAIEVGELEGRRLARLRQGLPGGEVLEIFTEAPTDTEQERVGEEGTEGVIAVGEPPTEAARLDRDETEGSYRVLATGWHPSGEARIRIAAPVAADSLAALLLRLTMPPAQP